MEKEINLTRARILRTIKDNEPIQIHSLVDKLKSYNLARSTIVYNLQQLKIRELITEEKKKTLGSPVELKTTPKAKPLLNISLKLLEIFK